MSKLMKAFFGNFSTELLRGVSSVAGLRVLGVLVGYVFVLLVARVFGASVLGQYQLTLQVISTGCLISMLGFNQLTLKYAARLQSGNSSSLSLRKITKLWGGTVFIAGTIASFVLAFFSEEVAGILFESSDAKKFILLASFLVPFQAFNSLACEMFRGIGEITLSEYFRSIHVRVINFSLLGIMLLVGGENVEYIYLFFVLATMSAFVVVALLLWFRFLKNEIKGKGEQVILGDVSEYDNLTIRQSLKQSLPMYQSSLLIFASTQALVYFVAYFESPAEVAKYNVSLQIANLTNFIFASVVTVSAPMYSRGFSESKDKLKKTIAESSRLIFWTSGTVSLIIAALSYPLLSMFGDEFSMAWPVLATLATANFINAFTGASGNLLDMTGGHAVRKNILIVNAMLTVILAFFAIQAFGLMGVAIAYLFNMCFGNFIGVYIVYRRLGINMMYFPRYRKSAA